MVHGGYRAAPGVLRGPAARDFVRTSVRTLARTFALVGAAGVWARDSKWDKPGIIRFFGGADLARPARTDVRAARDGRHDLAAARAF